MEELPLMAPFRTGGEVVAHIPVHVPLHVINSGREDIRHRVEHIADHIIAREVQEILMPRHGRLPPGNRDKPFRMLLIEGGIDGDHLRLDPYAGLHPERMDPADESGKPFRQLPCISGPVAKSPCIIGPPAEPAIIKHEKLDPHICGPGGKRQELLLAYIEIRGFPAVYGNGPVGIYCPAPLNAALREAMKRVRKIIETGCGIRDDGFGAPERAALAQLPAEAIGIDGGYQPAETIGRDLSLLHMVAGVHHIDGYRLAMPVIGLRAQEDHKRVMLIGGSAQLAVYV